MRVKCHEEVARRELMYCFFFLDSAARATGVKRARNINDYSNRTNTMNAVIVNPGEAVTSLKISRKRASSVEVQSIHLKRIHVIVCFLSSPRASRDLSKLCAFLDKIIFQ